MTLVSSALLMIDPNVDETPLSLLKVLGEPLLYHQIMQLRKFGIERYIVAVEKVNSEALLVAANLRRDGITIEFVSRLSALKDMLGSEDVFLMISDAIWSNDAHIEDMVNTDAPQILAFHNEEKTSLFELIDLNTRWAGLARLHGGILSTIDELPEDSAIQSTLLRLALQQDCRLKTIEYEASSYAKITDQTRADALSEKKMHGSKEYLNVRGVLETLFFYPLAQFIMRFLWKKREIRPVIGHAIDYSYALFFALAIVCALLQFNILSYILAIIGCFCAFLRQFQRHLKPRGDTVVAVIFINLSIFSILIISALYWQTIESVGIAAITFLLGYSVKALYFQPLYDRFIITLSDIFLIMIIATLWAAEIYVLLSIAILYSLWIFGGMILYQPLKKSQ